MDTGSPLSENEPSRQFVYNRVAYSYLSCARSFAASAPSLARSTPSLARSTPSLARSTPSSARRPLRPPEGPLGLRVGPSGPPEGPSGPPRRRVGSSSSDGCVGSSSVAVCWSWCCSAPHSGQKLAASSGSCALQFGQDSSSCCSWVCSSVNALFSLTPGVPFRVGYIPLRVEDKAPLLLARNTLL